MFVYKYNNIIILICVCIYSFITKYFKMYLFI
jgi:hypothetical protein